MMTKPDRYFRDQLEPYKKSPPPSAWNRIENNIHTKRIHKGRWLVAASVVMTISLVSLFTYSDSKNTNIYVQKEQPLLEENNKVVDISKIENRISENTPTTISPQPKSITPPGHNVKLNIKTPAAIELVQLSKEPGVETYTETEEHIRATVEQLTVITTTEQEDISPTEINQPTIESGSQSKKLHYSAADIQSRFLKKKTIPTTTRQKEENRFDRIADMAASMDYTNPLGELRQMKNELFALPVKGHTGVKN